MSCRSSMPLFYSPVPLVGRIADNSWYTVEGAALVLDA